MGRWRGNPRQRGGGHRPAGDGRPGGARMEKGIDATTLMHMQHQAAVDSEHAERLAASRRLAEAAASAGVLDDNASASPAAPQRHLPSDPDGADPAGAPKPAVQAKPPQQPRNSHLQRQPSYDRENMAQPRHQQRRGSGEYAEISPMAPGMGPLGPRYGAPALHPSAQHPYHPALEHAALYGPHPGQQHPDRRWAEQELFGGGPLGGGFAYGRAPPEMGFQGRGRSGGRGPQAYSRQPSLARGRGGRRRAHEDEGGPSLPFDYHGGARFNMPMAAYGAAPPGHGGAPPPTFPEDDDNAAHHGHAHGPGRRAGPDSGLRENSGGNRPPQRKHPHFQQYEGRGPHGSSGALPHVAEMHARMSANSSPLTPPYGGLGPANGYGGDMPRGDAVLPHRMSGQGNGPFPDAESFLEPNSSSHGEPPGDVSRTHSQQYGPDALEPYGPGPPPYGARTDLESHPSAMEASLPTAYAAYGTSIGSPYAAAGQGVPYPGLPGLPMVSGAHVLAPMASGAAAAASGQPRALPLPHLAGDMASFGPQAGALNAAGLPLGSPDPRGFQLGGPRPPLPAGGGAPSPYAPHFLAYSPGPEGSVPSAPGASPYYQPAPNHLGAAAHSAGPLPDVSALQYVRRDMPVMPGSMAGMPPPPGTVMIPVYAPGIVHPVGHTLQQLPAGMPHPTGPVLAADGQGIIVPNSILSQGLLPAGMVTALAQSRMSPMGPGPGNAGERLSSPMVVPLVGPYGSHLSLKSSLLHAASPSGPDRPSAPYAAQGNSKQARRAQQTDSKKSSASRTPALPGPDDSVGGKGKKGKRAAAAAASAGTPPPAADDARCASVTNAILPPEDASPAAARTPKTPSPAPAGADEAASATDAAASQSTDTVSTQPAANSSRRQGAASEAAPTKPSMHEALPDGDSKCARGAERVSENPLAEDGASADEAAWPELQITSHSGGDDEMEVVLRDAQPVKTHPADTPAAENAGASENVPGARALKASLSMAESSGSCGGGELAPAAGTNVDKGPTEAPPQAPAAAESDSESAAEGGPFRKPPPGPTAASLPKKHRPVAADPFIDEPPILRAPIVTALLADSGQLGPEAGDSPTKDAITDAETSATAAGSGSHAQGTRDASPRVAAGAEASMQCQSDKASAGAAEQAKDAAAVGGPAQPVVGLLSAEMSAVDAESSVAAQDAADGKGESVRAGSQEAEGEPSADSTRSHLPPQDAQNETPTSNQHKSWAEMAENDDGADAAAPANFQPQTPGDAEQHKSWAEMSEHDGVAAGVCSPLPAAELYAAELSPETHPSRPQYPRGAPPPAPPHAAHYVLPHYGPPPHAPVSYLHPYAHDGGYDAPRTFHRQRDAPLPGPGTLMRSHDRDGYAMDWGKPVHPAGARHGYGALPHEGRAPQPHSGPSSYDGRSSALTDSLHRERRADADSKAHRPRLELKPRTKPLDLPDTRPSSIFGDAKPREQVLAARGVDPVALDREIDSHNTLLASEHIPIAPQRLRASAGATPSSTRHSSYDHNHVHGLHASYPESRAQAHNRADEWQEVGRYGRSARRAADSDALRGISNVLDEMWSAQYHGTRHVPYEPGYTARDAGYAARDVGPALRSSEEPPEIRRSLPMRPDDDLFS